MKISHSIRKPFILVTFVTDDFGNEINLDGFQGFSEDHCLIDPIAMAIWFIDEEVH